MEAAKTEITFTRDQIYTDYWGCVHESIGRLADVDYIVTKEGRITYGEANHLANIIYSELAECDLSVGSGIGLFMTDHFKVAASMIGLLKAGHYIVPLDVNFPKATINRMLELAEVKLIVAENRYLPKLKSILTKDIQVIDYDALGFDQDVVDPSVNYDIDDRVQILFTSGSTGEPKGAIETYRYFLNTMFRRVGSSYIDPTMRPLRLSNFTFSGHHTSLFSALLQGVTLCYYNVKEDGFIGLSDWMREQQVTSFQATATVFRSWVSTLSPEDQFPSVMVASAGGERKLHEDIAALKRHFPNLQFIRMGFASTETQSVASALFPPDHDFPEGELPAGIPVDWVKVYIWDEDGNEVPKGAPGEIVVYSDTLVRGYINNPELTQKQFIPDPDNPNFQYYKTRDRGRFREDGQLIHMGRVDNMVKLKGVRIELTTIEAQIMAYPGIVQVGCNVFEDKNGNKKLAAYFVADQGLTVPVSDLRTFMARKLPLHMLPHFYIQMDSFPTTRTNKLDRHQLPQPQMTRPELANEYVPPVDETEKKLVDIWEDVIGIEGIGVTDDFFEVGGDSLIGVILFIEIERQFDRNLPVSVLLTASTIRKQAELISNPQTEEASSSIIEINPRGEKLPVLFIPGKGGYPTRIRHLARKLDAETPVYALQDIAEGRTDGSLRRIESVAAYYINEIRKVVPHGPYILLGESMGGMIAYEMANQLREFDEHPSIVGLLDTYNMGAENYMNKALSYYWLMIQKHVNILVRSDWEGRFDYFTFYRESFFKKVADEIRRYTNRNTRHASNLPRHISDLENANVRAAHKYAPGEYPGPVILFKALRGPHREYPMNGWEKVNIGQFVVHEIDCYHGSILFEPAVSELAAILSDYTENKAQGNHA